jgi:hypothetical protein
LLNSALADSRSNPSSPLCIKVSRRHAVISANDPKQTPIELNTGKTKQAAVSFDRI